MSRGLSPDAANGHSSPRRRFRLPLWIKRGWAFLFWLGACALAAYLWLHGARFGGMRGVVATATEPISALETARLLDILVRPGQPVRAGEVVARLDPSLIEAEMAYEEAVMLEAESTITGYQHNILQLVRQLEASVQEAETALALEQIRQKQELAQLEELERERVRLEGLRERQLIDETPLASLRPDIAALRIATTTRPEMLARLEQRLAAAKTRRAEAEGWLRAGEEGDVAAAIVRKKAARKAIYEAGQARQARQKELYTLRAGRDGVVSQIFAEPGNVVRAGDVIIRIVVSAASQVEGFLPEEHVSDVRVGQPFEVVRAVGRSPRHPARVLSISPEIMVLPGRISPISSQPVHGRRVLLALEGETDLIPGERVNIQSPSALRLLP